MLENLKILLPSSTYLLPHPLLPPLPPPTTPPLPPSTIQFSTHHPLATIRSRYILEFEIKSLPRTLSSKISSTIGIPEFIFELIGMNSQTFKLFLTFILSILKITYKLKYLLHSIYSLFETIRK